MPNDLHVQPQSRTRCLDNLDAARAWQPPVAVRTGDRVVGVRANSTHGTDVIRTAFAERLVPGFDSMVRPNFSLELGREDGTRAPTPPATRGLALAYRDHALMARRYDEPGIVPDLIALVDAVPLTDEEHSLAVWGSLLLAPDQTAILLPAAWHRTLMPRRRRLESAGLELLAPDLHRITRDAVVAAAPVAGMQVRAWGLRAFGEPGPLRAAAAAHAAFFTLANLGSLGIPTALSGLSCAVHNTRTVAVPAGSSAQRVAVALTLAAAST